MARKSAATTIETLHPMKRANLIGHNDAEKIFLDAWNNRLIRPLHPVWILSGPKGVGKATLAHRIARFVLANSSDDLDAGGLFVGGEPKKYSTLETDENSQEFQRYIDGGYSDLMILSLETEANEKSTKITVDSVRNMINNMRVTSSDELWRIVIIDSIDDMNKNAENSLLKILEEPPEKTLFLIVANGLSAVLPTIRSRSTVVRLGTLKDSDVKKLAFECVGIDTDMEKIDKAVKMSGGSVAKALFMLGGGSDDMPDMFQTVEMIVNPTVKASKLNEISKSLSASDDSMDLLLDMVHYLAMNGRAPLAISELYANASAEIASAKALNLDKDAVAFKIIRDIRKCLSIPTAI